MLTNRNSDWKVADKEMRIVICGCHDRRLHEHDKGRDRGPGMESKQSGG